MTLRIQARRWQEEAFQEWRKSRRGIVQVVTGAGKTIFAFLCIEDFLRANAGGRVVILVPTLALADQWYVGLIEDLGRRAEDIATFSGQEKPASPQPINIAILNTARDLTELLFEKPSFLVVDECHRAATPMNSRALGSGHLAALGLSATPVREYDDGMERFLVPILGPLIYEYSYDEAFRDGIVSPFSLINVRVELLPEEEQQILALTRRIGAAAAHFQKTGDELPLKRLLQRRANAASSAAMRVPVAAALVEQHRGERAIVFHEKVRGAEHIGLVLRERGHSVALYHSRMAANVRRDNLRLFRRGVFDVLVSCRALDEGMNVPETAVAVIASSSASERQRIQRLGRVLRPARGKTEAVIYTLYATSQEERRLVREAGRLESVAKVIWKQTRLNRHGPTAG